MPCRVTILENLNRYNSVAVADAPAKELTGLQPFRTGKERVTVACLNDASLADENNLTGKPSGLLNVMRNTEYGHILGKFAQG